MILMARRNILSPLEQFIIGRIVCLKLNAFSILIRSNSNNHLNLQLKLLQCDSRKKNCNAVLE